MNHGSARSTCRSFSNFTRPGPAKNSSRSVIQICVGIWPLWIKALTQTRSADLHQNAVQCLALIRHRFCCMGTVVWPKGKHLSLTLTLVINKNQQIKFELIVAWLCSRVAHNQATIQTVSYWIGHVFMLLGWKRFRPGNPASLSCAKVLLLISLSKAVVLRVLLCDTILCHLRKNKSRYLS